MRSGLKTNSREQEVAEISKSLKAVAKELNVPVIALSQLSRSVEQRGGDKKPILSDLRDSGQVEQDADMVIFTHRPEYFGQENYNWLGTDLDSKELFMVVIAKHRNGVIGEIPLSFKGEQTKVGNHPDSQNLYRSADFNSKPLQQIAEFSSKPLQQIADFNSKNIQRNTTFDADFNSKNIQQIKSLDFGNLSNAHPDAPNDLDIYENTPF
jgi:replicative DNA helicase